MRQDARGRRDTLKVLFELLPFFKTEKLRTVVVNGD